MKWDSGVTIEINNLIIDTLIETTYSNYYFPIHTTNAL